MRTMVEKSCWWYVFCGSKAVGVTLVVRNAVLLTFGRYCSSYLSIKPHRHNEYSLFEPFKRIRIQVLLRRETRKSPSLSSSGE